MATTQGGPHTAIDLTNSDVLPSTYQVYRPNGITDINACASGSGASQMKSKQKNRKKEETLVSALCAWIVEYQIGKPTPRMTVTYELANVSVGISINLLLLLCLAHISFPRARRQTRKFFELSYYDRNTGLYTQGWDDLYFVFFWIIIFTGLRAFVMDYVLTPLAQMGGIQKTKSRVRFAEQAWLIMYDSIIWPLGMVCSRFTISCIVSLLTALVVVSDVQLRLLVEPT